VDEVPGDEHFRARGLLFDQEHPAAGRLRLFGSPVKIGGEEFAATPAPRVGEHTDEVLSRVLAMSDAEIAALHAAGVI
jgi:crotonobetainyl-CoA:carnitine CoA-transferase CaiB-like acyl-CoA transferase